MREGDPLIAGSLRVWNRIGRATGAQAISLRIMEFAPGLSPGIRNDNCDEILYVLGWEHERADRSEVSTACGSGRVTVFINGHSHNISPDTGIYLRPGETFAVNNPGPRSIVMVSSQCPDPDRAPEFVEAVTHQSLIHPCRCPWFVSPIVLRCRLPIAGIEC
jgi:hypothetical protein